MPKITKEPTKKEEQKTNKTKVVKTEKKPTSSSKKTTSPKKSPSKSTTSKVTKSIPKKSTSKSVAPKTDSSKGKIRTSSKKPKTLEEKGQALLTDKFSVLEYYDLPYQYEKTVVKLLAQTPNTLFIYWNLSPEAIQNFRNQYGDNFFEVTKPVLIVHNLTMDYRFEVEISDFANCWYLEVKDTKCEYQIELGRKPIYHKKQELKQQVEYVYISSSNLLESPNDHILLERFPETVTFKNVKNQHTSYQKIDVLPKQAPMIELLSKIYSFYDKEYHVENHFPVRLNLKNPSSGNPTSTFK